MATGKYNLGESWSWQAVLGGQNLHRHFEAGSVGFGTLRWLLRGETPGPNFCPASGPFGRFGEKKSQGERRAARASDSNSC